MSVTSAPPLIVDPFAPMPLHTYLFMAIFLFNFSFAYLTPNNRLPLMFNLWTISVEEQFYLFWPWFVRYVPRRRIVAIPILMIAVACITRAISIPLKLDTFVWNNTFTRLDPIAVGILIALMPTFNPRPALRVVLVLVGFASWFFATYYCALSLQVSTLKISLGYPAVALGSGAFLLATLGAKSLRNSSAPVRCLTYLGKISYGLYVYNPIARTVATVLLFRGEIVKWLTLKPLVVLRWAPLVVFRWVPLRTWFAFMRWMPSIAWLVYVLLVFGINLALAAASYRWLEAPFLRLKERFTRVPSREV